VSLNGVDTDETCSLEQSCFLYIKRFILIRDVYHQYIKNNNILGLENETDGKLYLKNVYGFLHDKYIIQHL